MVLGLGPFSKPLPNLREGFGCGGTCPHCLVSLLTAPLRWGTGISGPLLKAWRKLRFQFFWALIMTCCPMWPALGVLSKWHKGSHFVGLKKTAVK